MSSPSEASERLNTLADRLIQELVALMQSGQNWQVVLHGGKGGDVKLEVKRTDSVLPPAKANQVLLEE